MLNENMENNLSIELEESKYEKVKTIKILNYYLHSKYKPLLEAKRIVDSSYKKNHLHILFGFGLGYIANAMLEKISDTDRLLIIEPSVKLFEIAMENSGNSLVINDKRVEILLGTDTSLLGNKLNLYFQEYMGRFTIIQSPNYPKIYPEFFRDVLKISKEKLMMEVINNNTRQMFSLQWQENYISNLYTAFTAYNIEEIKGKLTCPIVIASGGPSLTKQLPLLKKLKNKALIICAGSTVNSLLKEDINPNLVVTVDGGTANYKHFEKINIDNIPLVYPLIVHKGIPSNHNGKQVVFNISDVTVLNKLTNELLSTELGIVQTGHSVANFCFNIALQITSGPICLIGQDLAYTNKQTHALGNQGFSIVDETKEKQRNMFYEEGYYGEDVLTDFIFLGMKSGFEYQINKFTESGNSRDIFNCTEGGLRIKGFNQIPFSEFFERYCKIDYSDEIASLLPDRENRVKWNDFYERLSDLKNEYNGVVDLASESLEVLKIVENNNYLFDQDSISKLDEFDLELRRILENEFIFYILRPVLFKLQHSHLEIEDESEEEMNERIYNKSLILYKGIKEASTQGIEWITKLLKKVEKHII
ncbi:motility associated factor glycosyltransferase family protein [Metabacillus litoralis]|uniref:motility associated factor glycosyltransferase family protein n=1 Tax=Metabacillus litoralis TaxID=152268 RepID=UPI001CFF0600|nr:6-hydroxymethylpterin diphosphokinase MptE-like protein [Metabacillus litoralis]